MMISKKMEEALNEQIKMEFTAFYDYNQMGFAFESLGLPVFAGFFYDQAKEEQGHAMKISKYVVEQGAVVKLQTIPAPKADFTSAQEICEAFVEHELNVTKAVHKLVDLARQDNDKATEVFLHWKVKEQVEEVASASQLLDMVKKTKTEGQLLMLEGRVARMRGGE